jgi:hypothetical protein
MPQAINRRTAPKSLLQTEKAKRRAIARRWILPLA